MRRARLHRHAGVLSWLALALAFLSSLNYRAHAQTSQASLQGAVVSQSTSRPLERALVILRNPETNAQAYRYTNAQGIFLFSSLQPGVYRVRVDALGYQPEERFPVELPVASKIEVNFSLQGTGPAPAAPGAAAGAPPPATPAPGANANNILAVMYGADAAVPQAVLIRLPVSVAETLSGTLSRLIDENKILELPLQGRDVYTLLVLNPGVTSDNATGRGLGLSVNGQPVFSSNFLLDGVDNNDLQVTGAATRVSADAVQEYRMATHNYTAEFGRSSGFIANVITRSGTNRFHGSLFEFYNHDQLNANSFTNNWRHWQKEPLSLHQFGGVVGGPVKRDRLFFLGSYEQMRSYTRSQPQPWTFPSQAAIELAALVSVNSKAHELLRRFPPPKNTVPTRDPYFVQKQIPIPLNERNHYILGRTDYASVNGGRVNVRYGFFQKTQDDYAFSPYPEFSAPIVIRGQNLGVNYTRDMMGGTNELKFGMNRNSVRFDRPHPELPTFSSSDGVLLPGSDAAFDYAFRDTVFHVLDNYNRLVGRHALSLGFEWRPFLHDSLHTPARDGVYGFPGMFNFLFDLPSSLTITINRQTGRVADDADFQRFYFQSEAAAFIQDNWKLASRLTVNLGVRWELFGSPSPRNDTTDLNFVFGPGSMPGERIAGGRMAETYLYRTDFNNFAPRIGFALDLTGRGKTVLRGSYGVFFDRIFNNFWMDSRSNNLRLILRARGFDYLIPARNAIVGTIDEFAAEPIAVDQRLRTPYAQSWFIGVQKEVAANTLIEINQTGSLGRKLAASDAINRSFQFPLTPTNPDGRQNPAFLDINYRSNQSHSDNVALQFVGSRRLSRTLQFQAAYTYARSRDVQSDPFRRKASDRRGRLADTSFSLFKSTASFTRQMDPSSDYGHSDFDQRHNLVFSFTAQAPLVRWLPRAMSGWQVSALAGFRSGFPFSTSTNQPESIDFSNPLTFAYVDPQAGRLNNNRLDYVGASPDDAGPDTRIERAGSVVLLDRAKFRRPANNRIGTSARNEFYGPGFWNTDLSLSRSFAVSRLGEEVSLQVRLEMFNLFNHTNLSNPETLWESPLFGEAQFGRQGIGSSAPGASPLNEQPRHIQLGFKLYF